jgi:gliding motility-associated-like protein
MKKLSLILLAITTVVFSTMAQVTSNSPICSSETLLFSIGTTGKEYIITSPSGTSSSYFSKPININGSAAENGTYVVSIISNTNDTVSVNVEVMVTQVPSQPIITGKTSYCEGEALALSASASNSPDTYKWSFNDGSTYFQNPLNIPARKTFGTTVTVVASSNNCESTSASITLTVNENPTTKPVVSGLKNPYCENDLISLTLTNAGSFYVDWKFPDNTTQNIKKLNTNATLPLNGIHNITYFNNGCSGPSTAVNIIVTEVPPTPTIVSNQTSICTGDTLEIYSPGNDQFGRSWTLPNGSITSLDTILRYNVQNSDSGLYSLKLVNGTCSSATVQIHLETKQSPILIGSYTNAPLCEQDSFVFYTKWKFGGTTTLSNEYGLNHVGDSLTIPVIPHYRDYYVAVTNDNGCKSKVDTFITPIIEKIRKATIASNSPVCENSPLSLLAAAHDSTTYYWEGPKGFRDTALQIGFWEAELTQTGKYTVRYENMCDTVSTFINITVDPVPTFNIVGDSSVCEDDLTLATFGVDTDYDSYQWNTGEITKEITVAKNNFYSVTVTNQYGCITKKGKDIPTKCFPRFYAPNAFTPNGDGTNDIFYLVNHNLEIAQFTIFNSIGQVVFETRDLSKGWDGTYLGTPCKAGKYVYKIEYDTVFKGVVRSQLEHSYFFLIR